MKYVGQRLLVNRTSPWIISILTILLIKGKQEKITFFPVLVIFSPESEYTFSTAQKDIYHTLQQGNIPHKIIIPEKSNCLKVVSVIIQPHYRNMQQFQRPCEHQIALFVDQSLSWKINTSFPIDRRDNTPWEHEPLLPKKN